LNVDKLTLILTLPKSTSVHPCSSLYYRAK